MSKTTKLNSQQIKAVNSLKDRVLVLAGAGTGKTSTLVSRIINEIHNGIPPSEIVALTFTNKAANEIKERVANELTDQRLIADLTVGTFHGVANRMIRDNYEVLALNPYYQIIDASEQKKIIKEIVSENKDLLDVDDFEDVKDSHIVKISFLKISSMKEAGITYDQAQNPPDVDWDLVKIFELYEQKKYLASLLDFADILILCVKLLENEKVRSNYENRWTSMLIDEFQDTNRIQMRWINLINSRKLFVVGDDDQSIYKFRGADIENILQFEDTQKDPDIIYLEENYRSTKSILSVANSIISYNEVRHEKSLWTNNPTGKEVYVDKYNSAMQESTKVVERIDDLVMSGVSQSSIAVIYRANYLSRLLEKPLMRLGINYKITGGTGFWQRAEIKDVLSYLMVATNRDNHIALERSLKFPRRGVGAKTIQKIVNFSTENKLHLIDSINKMIEDKIIKGKVAISLKEYTGIIESLDFLGVSESVSTLLRAIKIRNIFSDESDIERLDNINELLAASIEFEQESGDLNHFLANASLMGSVDDKNATDAVSLTTAHSSKGLEYDYVFIIGVEEGIFPSSRSISTKEDIEEERRLCYVAITRAKKELRISHAKTRTQGGDFNKPAYESRFIVEIDPDLIKIKNYSFY